MIFVTVTNFTSNGYTKTYKHWMHNILEAFMGCNPEEPTQLPRRENFEFYRF